MSKDTASRAFKKLLGRLQDIALIGSAYNIIEYDMEVSMPAGGNDHRARVASALSGIRHRQATAAGLRRAAAKLMEGVQAGRLQGVEAAIVSRAYRDIEKEARQPQRLVQEISAVTTAAHHVWAEARQKSDFRLFLPTLEEINGLIREKTEAIGYRDSPYDALLDDYEPGMTAAQVEAIFGPLSEFTAAFIRRLAEGQAPDRSPALIAAPIDVQERIGRELAALLGFDFGSGRLDRSAHPFSNRLHPGDVRITTRYDEADLLNSLYSTIHETGHALYEAGQPQEWFGTCAGEAASYGIHESQSRTWENLVGRSRPFCELLAGMLERHGLGGRDIGALYRSLNHCQPSLIRVDADEVTYNLHVALRFDIERALIEGRLAAKDLPEAWNAKVRDYLGIEVPDDARGVLQDVHWSAGLFGYFPSYALGNLYAAQLFEAVRRDLPELDEDIRSGRFAPLRDWFRDKVWRHGAVHCPVELITLATGAAPSAEPFKRYLEDKFTDIYRL